MKTTQLFAPAPCKTREASLFPAIFFHTYYTRFVSIPFFIIHRHISI